MKNSDLQFNKNEDEQLLLLSDVRIRLEKIRLGGGKKNIEKQHEKGKLTARERVAYLLDKDHPSFEIGAFAGYDMYEEQGGCPAAGVIVVIGKVSGKQCIVVANRCNCKSRRLVSYYCKEKLTCTGDCYGKKLPIIYLVDSAGVFLPMQDEIFPDKEHFGRIFRNNAIMSSMGISQIAAVMGSCVAGGAYLPIMSDEAMIVDKTALFFLQDPFLVKGSHWRRDRPGNAGWCDNPFRNFQVLQIINAQMTRIASTVSVASWASWVIMKKPGLTGLILLHPKKMRKKSMVCFLSTAQAI
jgi:acetyl-CoA carboxylase carboxyltransferase component